MWENGWSAVVPPKAIKAYELIDKPVSTTNERPKFKYSFEGKKDIKFLYKLLSNVKPTSLNKLEKEVLESILNNIAFELEG